MGGTQRRSRTNCGDGASGANGTAGPVEHGYCDT
jgi:hypothetical protein